MNNSRNLSFSIAVVVLVGVGTLTGIDFDLDASVVDEAVTAIATAAARWLTDYLTKGKDT